MDQNSKPGDCQSRKENEPADDRQEATAHNKCATTKYLLSLVLWGIARPESVANE
jgi:hypothetical protein|tara:strand:- start:52 stop:216 length:165 start_codon:yes stop_codon:yes gene_type:complete